MKKILGVCGLLTATAIGMAAQSSDERWLTRHDLNGDGVADSVWCNPNADGGAGVVEVIDGATGALIVRFVGDAGARFGAAASAVDDISGDGLADLVVGAPGQQRAYLIDGPFADVAEPIVSTSRLSFVMAPPSDITVESFGADVAGIHDLDGDDVPDIRVAATVVSASGGSESLSLVYQSITGALIGIGRRAGNLRPLETARGDTDLNVAVDTRDLATVVDGLGMPSPEGAVDGDVTRDGAIDGADVAMVLDALGTQLYLPTAIDVGPCASGSYAVVTQEESMCIARLATSTIAAEIMAGIAVDQAGGETPFDPSEIIHPLPNECGNKIAACLSDPRVIAAAQLVRNRCWPSGPPNTVIGHIYCSPCSERRNRGSTGYTRPQCDTPGVRKVDITICDRSDDACRTLAHELVHVSQACQGGLFSNATCGEYWRTRFGTYSAICRELEAYALTHVCGSASAIGCCDEACRSVVARWQSDPISCINCCHQMVGEACCNGGLLNPSCDTAAEGWCARGGR